MGYTKLKLELVDIDSSGKESNSVKTSLTVNLEDKRPYEDDDDFNSIIHSYGWLKYEFDRLRKNSLV